MSRITHYIGSWFAALFKVWRREFYLVFKDPGVMIFFFLLPTAYPIIYTLIYNPEIVEKMPVAVVDNCRSAESRELVRMAGAAQSIKIAGYAANLQEARELFNEHKVVAVMSIPSDYSDKLNRGESADVEFFCNMGLLLRYRAFLSSFTDLQIALGSKIRLQKVEAAGLLGSTVSANSSAIKSEAIMLGDPTSGFASFIIPGILILIMQQSMVLGVTMLAGGAAERRRRNGGRDPLAIDGPPTARIVGKVLCYVVLYIPMVLFMLQIVPNLFSLPHLGNPWHYMLFVTPLLVASALFGLTLAPFITEREASMAVVVFTSAIFLFLSGLTWPRYAMNGFWTLVGDFVPATWGVEGFIRMNSNGATLAEQQRPYLMLWALAVFYFITAYIIQYRWKKRNYFCSTPTR